MPPRVMTIATLGLVVPLAACLGSDDPSIHVPAELVGSWQKVGLSGDVLVDVTYRDDGTYVLVDYLFGGSERGTFSADDREITRESNFGGLRETFTYFVRGDRLLARALLPEGAVDGLFGTWRSRLSQKTIEGEDTYDDTMIVRPDGTATFTEILNGSLWVLEASWTVEDDRIVLDGDGGNLDLPFIEGGAFGDDLLTRIADE